MERMTSLRATAVVAVGLALMGASHAPTIPLPPDLALEPPAADVPPNMARFAGAWGHGAWDSVLPHVLLVEAVDREGHARVVSAGGDDLDTDALALRGAG
jgi:hypothetical protein